FGGANAHALLAEHRTPAPEPAAGDGLPRTHLLPLSARSAAALRQRAEDFRQLLSSGGHNGAAVSLAGLCRTGAVPRRPHAHRLAVLGGSHEELAESLDAFARGRQHPSLYAGRRTGAAPGPVFVYCGMGPQSWGMGQKLMADEPVYRRAVERCD